jgi:hypothetical protein
MKNIDAIGLRITQLRRFKKNRFEMIGHVTNWLQFHEIISDDQQTAMVHLIERFLETGSNRKMTFQKWLLSEQE